MRWRGADTLGLVELGRRKKVGDKEEMRGEEEREEEDVQRLQHRAWVDRCLKVCVRIERRLGSIVIRIMRMEWELIIRSWFQVALVSWRWMW